MNIYRVLIIAAAVASLLILSLVYQTDAVAAGPKVSESLGGIISKHNLSAKAWLSGSYSQSNTNTYKATDDPTGNPKGQQICIFCHTPHSANVEGGAPLWNRKFSTKVFQRYSGSSTFVIKNNTNAQYGSQPDGSSKLCLSCHDGASNMGTLFDGSVIAMVGADVIAAGPTSFNPDSPSTNKMRYGHHPVSFVYNAAVASAINTGKGLPVSTYAFPPGISAVKLDKNSKIQCTTCHDAHQNQSDDTAFYSSPNNTRKIAPFWVYGGGGSATVDQSAVCTACHPIDGTSTPGFAAPWVTPP